MRMHQPLPTKQGKQLKARYEAWDEAGYDLSLVRKEPGDKASSEPELFQKTLIQDHIFKGEIQQA